MKPVISFKLADQETLIRGADRKLRDVQSLYYKPISPEVSFATYS